MICLVLFCIGAHFALFPNLLKQIFGKQAGPIYGILYTGIGLTSLAIVGLIFSPIGHHYYTLFYLFGTICLIDLVILYCFFQQTRFEPDWEGIFMGDQTYHEELLSQSWSKS